MERKRRNDQVEVLLAARTRLEARILPRGVILVGMPRGRDRTHWDAGQARWLLAALRERVRRDESVVWTPHDPLRDGFDRDELCADLATASLFDEPRFVVVEEGSELVGSGSAASGAGDEPPFARALRTWAAQPELGHRLFLGLSALGAETRLLKELQERLGEGLLVVALRPLYDNPPSWNPDPLQTELARFVARRVRDRKLRVGPRSILDLASRVGSDLSALDGELEKLAACADAEGRVEEREVRSTVSGGAVEADTFQFTDLVLRGDVRAALGWLGDIERRGAKRQGKDSGGATQDLGDLAMLLVSALVRETRKLLLAAEMREKGLPFETIAQALSVPDVTVARDAFRNRFQARDVAGCTDLLHGLRELELDLKLRGVPVDVAFARLVLRSKRGVPSARNRP